MNKNEADNAIEKAYYATCSGVQQIKVMDISKVFRAGREAWAAGARGHALESAVREAVQAIVGAY